MADPVSPPVTPEGQTQTSSPAELQQIIDDVASRAALGDPNTPIEVKLQTGQVYRGVPSKVIENLSKSQEEASVLIRTQKDEMARLKTELEEVRQASRKAETPQNDAEYKPERYYELFQEDPLKAQSYLDKFDPLKQEMQRTLETVRHRGELERFQNAVNFYPDDSAKAVFADEFVKSKLEPNAANYELVYWRMQAANKLPQPVISRMSPGQAPPPSLRGGSGGAPQDFDMSRFEDLPPAQMAQVIQRMKDQGYR